MKPKLVQLLFFWLLAVVVWLGIKTVGGLLIGALLVIPVVTSRNWAGSFLQLTVFSVVTAVSGVVGGLLLSITFDVPPSSLIIACLIGLFIGQLAIHHVVLRRRQR